RKRRAIGRDFSGVFEKIRRLRETGGSRAQEYEIQEPEPIYIEVDEEEYQEHLKEREQDNFIEDDDGKANLFAEDDLGKEYSEESDYDDRPMDGKRKRIKELGDEAEVRPNARLNSFFQRAAATQLSKPKIIKSTAEETAFLSGLLKDLDDDSDEQDSSDLYEPLAADQTDVMMMVKNLDGDTKGQDNLDSCKSLISDQTDVIMMVKDLDDDTEKQDNSDLYDPLVADQTDVIMMVKDLDDDTEKQDNSDLYDPLVADQTDVLMMVNDLDDDTEKQDNSDLYDPFVADQTDVISRMFWIDAYEKQGNVHLFGKIFDKNANLYVSCCLIVNNINRNIFVLPRQCKLDDNGNETNIKVTMDDVFEEIESLRHKYKIPKIAAKTVSRKYAFELSDVPVQSDYLKVVYPFSSPSYPSDLSGKTFSRIFGAQSSATELFLIKRKIKGPCWLEIEGAQEQTAKVSWCKRELFVKDPKNVKPLKETIPLKSPPLTIMSLSLRTIMNHQKQANEIVAFSVRVYPKVFLDGPIRAKELQSVQQTSIRQLNDKPWWPTQFEDMVQGNKNKLNLTLEKNEYSLLNRFLAIIKQNDPDVLVGHNIIGFELPILLQRMDALKVKDWSWIGRLHRQIWPSFNIRTSNKAFKEGDFVNGRLICDTFFSAKDLIKSKTYSLTELALSQLGVKRKDFDCEKVVTKYERADTLFDFVLHCRYDTILTSELMFKLQILPLTKQLTNLAGNIWSKTLASASRAVRNEYLLLHEFHQNKYICPDKSYNKSNIKNAEKSAGGGEEDERIDAVSGSKKKPTYAGGLVLEPKKGFYDKYVVMLDFNSLYPSIIQEYNICFTTIGRTGKETDDLLPDLPEPDLSQGILPKLIASLVNKRKLVKNLMKDPKASPDDLAQYDIRQKALKLTANSMYGCLGFPQSRFYAKALAMLITSKGREILQNTVSLAEDEGIEVIYGDTDSIMIHTNTIDLHEASEIGKILKKKVNQQYKLLEIEIDGFFEKMLLLKKKKYASVVVEENNGNLTRSYETKGIDLVRRDWCELVRDASKYILDQILSSSDRTEVVNNIHEYLIQLGNDIRSGKFFIDKFILNKNLTKAPEAYADIKSQSHVRVALRMKDRGMSARQGDTIPYVICIKEDENSIASKNLTDKAFHPDEIRKEDSNLRPDFEWYLSQQIHAAVARLCEHIEGTSSARIAECLGLDKSKFVPIASNSTYHTYNSQISDDERFKHVDKLMIKCIHCRESYTFEGFNSITGHLLDETGFYCGNPNCMGALPTSSILAQLTCSIRFQVKKFYDSWNVCEDPTCGYRTRNISRKRCAQGCRGKMVVEFSEYRLHNQLNYYAHLFDVDKIKNTSQTSLNIGDNVMSQIKRLNSLAGRYLTKSGYG
ncbi:8459_t:CDS:10, partial [Gigaspora margarita]